jgi:hypothetical protein
MTELEVVTGSLKKSDRFTADTRNWYVDPLTAEFQVKLGEVLTPSLMTTQFPDPSFLSTT